MKAFSKILSDKSLQKELINKSIINIHNIGGDEMERKELEIYRQLINEG